MCRWSALLGLTSEKKVFLLGQAARAQSFLLGAISVASSAKLWHKPLQTGKTCNNRTARWIDEGIAKIGCVNINLVTPTHLAPAIAAAIELAKKTGLKLPIVYNSGGYDSAETLKLLERFIDIYMPDMKFSDPKVAKELSAAADYPQVNRQAVLEMHRQTGDLVIEDGIAVKAF